MPAVLPVGWDIGIKFWWKSSHEQYIILTHSHKISFPYLNHGGVITIISKAERVYVKNPLLKCHFYMIYFWKRKIKSDAWKKRSKKFSIVFNSWFFDAMSPSFPAFIRNKIKRSIIHVLWYFNHKCHHIHILHISFQTTGTRRRRKIA